MLEYICVILLFFSLELEAQVNDNSAFVLAVGTTKNQLVRPIGCDGKLWLSVAQQIPKNTGGYLKDDEWWWEYPVGTKISSTAKYDMGAKKVNEWDLIGQPTYSGVHYYLQIKNIQEADFGPYRFVVKLDDSSGLLLGDNINRYEDIILKQAEEGIYCSNPISFGARKEYISQAINFPEWNINPETVSLTDNVLMVGPFQSTTGNSRERYQITEYTVNAVYDRRAYPEVPDPGDTAPKCQRYGYNFKLQVFDVSEEICENPVAGKVCAKVVQQQSVVFPLDAINDKLAGSYPSNFLSSYFTDDIPGMDQYVGDWTTQVIPVWYALGPLLISPGQYLGMSTGGCFKFKKGPPSLYTNVPNQKSYYFKTPLQEWTYNQQEGNGVKTSTFKTAKALGIGEITGPLQESGSNGPFSFGFDAEFYDIEPVRFDPTIPPVPVDTTSRILLIVLLIILGCCLCFTCIMCMIAGKNMKAGRERRRFKMQTMLGSCNISSENGERLPPGWFEEKSPPPQCVPYYYNPGTKESMWDIPCFG